MFFYKIFSFYYYYRQYGFPCSLSDQKIEYHSWIHWCHFQKIMLEKCLPYDQLCLASAMVGLYGPDSGALNSQSWRRSRSNIRRNRTLNIPCTGMWIDRAKTGWLIVQYLTKKYIMKIFSMWWMFLNIPYLYFELQIQK